MEEIKSEKLIEKFFDGTISSEEEQELKNLLKEDATVREALQFQVALKKTMQEEDDMAWRKKFTEYEKEFTSVKEKEFPLIRYAAIVGLLVGLVISIMWVIYRDNSTMKLYQAFYTPAENISYPLTRGDQDDLINLAFSTYEEGDYEGAIPYLKQLQEETGSADISLYIGSAHLALNQTADAIAQLNQKPNVSYEFKYRFQWYLALAYLQADNVSDARKLLEDLIENGDYKVNAAESLLSKLP
ncbi:tetratricopeptide repeat protein [Belliella sp. DSM 111904]|uniref:Tetratricopeptide repeat protein n=1 Tax=Belliella filtrata TaxID=2923435 RepID=A0ABS9V043_9BACT|nr:tetratricopeptide repeat protein [Belliella filtrata]MCH7409792.1 tetratricopeptide repeat protein [Belliella filtrata]